MSATVRRSPRPDAVASSSAERFARRARSRRWRSARPALWALVALTLLVGLWWVVFSSSLLAVDRVDVTGTDELAVADVTAAAQVPLDTPLARVDMDAIRTRVSTLPRVETAEVRRRWPHTVEITVRERTPVAVRKQGDTYDVVDRSAVAFDRAAGPVTGMPTVTAPDQRSLRALLSVVVALPPGLSADVRTVTALSPEDVRLSLANSRTVLWGGPDRSARKAAVLAVLLKRPAKIYNVSAPDAPTTKGTPRS